MKQNKLQTAEPNPFPARLTCIQLQYQRSHPTRITSASRIKVGDQDKESKKDAADDQLLIALRDVPDVFVKMDLYVRVEE